MSNLSNNSVETVNAAATAIVTAESRIQPTSVQKRRWGSCWSLYWCFGSYKHRKRIGSATLVPEATAPGVAAPVAETLNHSSTTVFPFIAPPSSPASFLQSDPPSATHSPAGPLSLTSLSVNAYSSSGAASIFVTGPYAYETQLVSPPVFSTFTTEPSTASFTPPPEPVQLTTPSSPEVPFAQLLASSLARTRRNSGSSQKFPLSQYEYQPYQVYPGSPGGYVISPGSTIPNSGTSSPFPDKQPIIEFRVGETAKYLGYEFFPSQKWGSRLGSGSVTPNGLGSRLGSGSLTPNGGISRLDSGSLTPNGWQSKLDSGSLTPTEPVSRDNLLTGSRISEVVSLANSDHGSQEEEVVVGHRVSFELPSEVIPKCLEKDLKSSLENVSNLEDVTAGCAGISKAMSEKALTCDCGGESESVMPGKADDQVKQCQCKHHSSSVGSSSKEFNFDSTNGDVTKNSTIGCEWWTNEKVVGNDRSHKNNWTFFPMLQPEVS